MVFRTDKFSKVQMDGRKITVPINRLSPVYDGIYRNSISDQHQETILIMSAHNGGMPKVDQGAFQQPTVANPMSSNRWITFSERCQAEHP